MKAFSVVLLAVIIGSVMSFTIDTDNIKKEVSNLYEHVLEPMVEREVAKLPDNLKPTKENFNRIVEEAKKQLGNVVELVKKGDFSTIIAEVKDAVNKAIASVQGFFGGNDDNNNNNDNNNDIADNNNDIADNNDNNDNNDDANNENNNENNVIAANNDEDESSSA